MRHSTRRPLTVIGSTLTVAALAVGTVSCATPSAAPDEPPTLEIVFKGDQTRADAMNAAIDIFLEDHPDWVITTDFQSGSEYMQKLSVRFASQDAPDIMRQERESLREFGDRGVLLDLADMIDTSAIPESVVAGGTVDGKLLGAVSGVSSLAYVVDAEAYAQYGVELPDTDTWSWDEYRDSAAALSKASGGQVWGTEFPVGDVVAFGVWLRQHGEDLWNEKGELAFTQKTATEWFKTWAEFRDAGATPPAGAIDNLGVAAEQSAIGRGLVGSMIIPSNSFAAFNGVTEGGLELANFPGESEGTQRGQQLIPGMYWSVAVSSKFPEEAAALISFFLNDVEGNRAMGGTHGMPANPKVAEAISGDLSADDRASFDYVIDLGAEKLMPYTPAPAGTSELVSEMVSIGEQIRAGQITPDEAGKIIFETVKSVLGS